MDGAAGLRHLAADTGPPLLRLEGVGITYPGPAGPVVAVEGVSLDIRAGERLVLLGPSGCGKSSLLRAVGGFLAPAAGRVLHRGAEVRRPGPDRMAVFQEFDQLLPWRTVLGNVRFAVERARGLPRAAAEAEAREWVGRVGLARFADAYPHTLSGGMKQRVAIARAFAVRPDILLLDEPFAALDALTRRQMQDELLSLCEGTGATVLLVTHAVDEAVLVGTRVAALSAHPGRVVAEFAVPPAARSRGSGAFAALEAELHATLFGQPARAVALG